jgi:hypothetical protein
MEPHRDLHNYPEGKRLVIPRNLERLGGLFIAVAGGCATYYSWQAARHEEYFVAAGAAGPAFVLIGLALVAFPGYKSERLARGESLEGLAGWALLTPRWKGVSVIGCVLAAAYFFLLKFGL